MHVYILYTYIYIYIYIERERENPHAHNPNGPCPHRERQRDGGSAYPAYPLYTRTPRADADALPLSDSRARPSDLCHREF